MKRVWLWAMSMLLAVASMAGMVAAQRVRAPLDDGWRFTKGDPPGVDTRDLLYDVRPVAKGDDKRERAAEATAEAARLGPATHPVLKPWILPTGNAFLGPGKAPYVRPAGDPGGTNPYVQPDFDDNKWTAVTLPHDWAIAGPFEPGSIGVGGSMGRLPSPGVGWYRRKLSIPAGAKGQRFALVVEGAMSYTAVWCNGHLVGGWPYGYATWQVDLTPYLHPGDGNQLAIRLDNPPDFSRWYPGAGLYRHVFLLRTAPVHVAEFGTQITTPEVSPARAEVQVRVTVGNDGETTAGVDVETRIFALNADDHVEGAAVATLSRKHVELAAGAHEDVQASATVANPRLWGPVPTQKPNRYVAVTSVSRNGKALDRYETRFGVRKVEFKPDGVFVNGERIRIQGVNQHHDFGALGAAWNQRAAERQLDELQAMGVNAIRMSHNPPAPELLEMTDRRGILVLDEIFDAWMRQKTPFDFHLIFKDWHEQDLRAFMRRDRNHPSIFLWSVGNEVGEQRSGESGAALARELVQVAHQEDPTRLAAASMNAAKPDSPFAAALDVVSLNYQGEGIRDTPEYEGFSGLKTPPQYDAFHEKFPERTVLSTESAAALSSRDNYLFPVAKGISNPVRDRDGGDAETHQVSAYEVYAADFGASADKVFAAQDRHPYVAGEFVWTGWDYLGEPTPYYSSRSSYFGIIDLAGFPKDRFYLYQSRWRPEVPMAHILPHWTWPDRVGKVTPVHVFTSGDEAELFLNGRSLGRKKKEPFQYRLRWDDVVYEPGTLKVVAYRNGREWATDEVSTAGSPVKLELKPDRSRITADGQDLAFIAVRVVDEKGRTAPLAATALHIEVDGAGELAGVDNGDPTDMTAFPAQDRKAFHGRCMVLVRSRKGQAGAIRLRVTAPSLGEARVEIAASAR